MSPQPATTGSWPRPRQADESGSALLESVRQGQPHALQSLIDDHWSSLHAFAFRLLGCADAADDVVQHAFIRLWERRDRWSPGSDPRLILFTIVRNLSYNQLESDRARLRRDRAPRVPRPLVSTPAELLDESELVRHLESSLALLSPRRREALILARFHHLSHAQVAEVMGLSQRTVTNHITAALSALESAMSRFLED